MSLLPPNPSGLAYALSRLTRNHGGGLKYALDQLKRSYQYSGGPFSAHTRNQTGASSFGSIMPSLNNVTSQVGAQSAQAAPYAGIGSALSQLAGGLQQATDPLTNLYTQLLDQLQSPVARPEAVNKDDLMKQVQSALNPIYDQRVNAATSQTKKNEADVKNMYASLSQDYKDLLPQQKANEAANQQQVKDIYGELRSNIEGSYGRVSQEQSDLFNQLGIQSALPATLDKQNQSVIDATTAASENQAQQAQQYMDQGNADQTYYQEQAPIANMTGIEVNSNLMSQLSTYLDQINAERSSGIQNAYMDQLGQAQNNLTQQQSAADSETARRQEMLWQMLQSQNQSTSNASPLDSFMSQLSPQAQQSVGGAFTQLQRSPNAVYGKTEDPRNPVPGTYVDTTPEWYYSQADQMLQSGQIDQQTHDQLLQYLQLYFGSGK